MPAIQLVLAAVLLAPAAAPPAGRPAVTLHVSRFGDDSDGTTWPKAFRTIARALAAVPGGGGHRIVVRPDTYREANLFPAHRGAAGAYNSLEGDRDGSRGSGATGWVIIDSGDPEKGFKSFDWWSTIKATSKGWSPAHVEETFSAIGWDRWALRGIYATGADAGLFWDCTDHVEPFTVVVEDCVGIGRAFGGGVGNCLSRPDEPIAFRRSLLWALDWWGDTAGGYVRVENKAMPARPDVVFEDCTLVSPQCSLKGGNYGFHTFTRAAVKGCRLVTLNFSQPGGVPTDGIIQSVERGRYLHVDLEDSTLMGFKVFGVKVQKGTEPEIGYSVKGSVRAYVQYQQAVPAGFVRLARWPAEVFAAILPDEPVGGWRPRALEVPPATAAIEGARTGATLHVSKLGDDSDGKTWKTAFRTIGKALAAVPDDRGGHRIVVRPDTYMEALLDPAHPGAAGAYDVLEGDVDGAAGSGATGPVIVDSGDPEKGFKCIDWWGFGRCAPDYSSIRWDRWALRRLYMTGAEGSGWDLTCRKGAEFSAVVEDCVAIGRFSGICVGAFVGRRGEPVTIRRSHLWALDLWGDAAGAYVRAERKEMPDFPDVVFDGCTLVGPDNALQAGNPGFDGYTRVRVRNSRLVSLNFSQPGGTPSTGIIYSTLKGKYLHVDLEDCLLMGYKVFGSGGNQFGTGQGPPPGGDIPYTVKGRVAAYVQFQQDVPKGFLRLAGWPADAFGDLLPPAPASGGLPRPAAGPGAPPRRLARLPGAVSGEFLEMSPVHWRGRPLLAFNRRPGSSPKLEDMTLHVADLDTGKELARFGIGHSFASAFVEGDELSVFASDYDPKDWTHDIHRFRTTDLKEWVREPAIAREGGEHLFNASVCRDGRGYVMAYESNLPVQFCFKFARSTDLVRWEKVPGIVFAGRKDEYSACPALRFVAPHYYVIYVREATGGRRGWVPWAARSTDLAEWELSPRSPILDPTEDEGINNSDLDLFERAGRTYIFYLTGDQATWGQTRCAVFPGTLAEFLAGLFPPGEPGARVSARR